MNAQADEDRETQEPQRGRFSTAVNRFLLALRLSLRSLTTQRARSVLIAITIAIPVAVVSTMATLALSSMPTAEEKIAVDLGTFESRVNWLARTAADQNPFVPEVINYDSLIEVSAVGYQSLDPRRLLPQGDSVEISYSSTDVLQGDARLAIETVVGQSWDPRFAGRYDLVDGEAPGDASKVAINAELAQFLDLELGDPMQVLVDEAPVSVTVSGIIDASTSSWGQPRLFASAGLVPHGPIIDYFLSDVAVDPAHLAELNAQGVQVFSRGVMAQAGLVDLARTSYYTDGASTWTLFGSLAGALGLGLILLLAGAAFRIGVAEDRRTLALYSSAGADPTILRHLVMMNGLLHGFAGGVIGVAAGTGIAAVVVAATPGAFWGLHSHPIIVLGLVLVSIVAGWLAALLPARAASKQDAVTGLRLDVDAPGRRRIHILRSALLLGAGSAGLLYSSIRIAGRPGGWSMADLAEQLLFFASALLVIASALWSIPWILHLLERSLGRAHPTIRLATRDISRNSIRTAPVVASILTVSLLGTLGLIAFASVDASYARNYSATAPEGTVVLSRMPWNGQLVQSTNAFGFGFDGYRTLDDWGPDRADPARYLDAYRSVLDEPASTRVVHGTSNAFLSVAVDGEESQMVVPRADASKLCATAERGGASSGPGDSHASPYCETRWLIQPGENISHATPLLIIGTVDDLEALTGAPVSSEARVILESGGAIVPDAALLDDGRFTLDWIPSADARNYNPERPVEDIPLLGSVTVPGAVHTGTVPRQEIGILISPDTADSWGIASEVMAVLIEPGEELSLDDLPRLTSAIAGAGGSYIALANTGPQRTDPLASWIILSVMTVLVLGTAGVSLALARLDARRNAAALTAIGAPRGTLRAVSWWQALLLTGLATLLGTALALLMFRTGTAAGGDALPFAPPWSGLLLFALGTPVLIGLVAWLVPPGSRIGEERPAID